MPAWPLPPGQPAIYPSTPGGLTAPSITDWQFNYNDVLFGADSSIGITKVRGLGGLPPVGSKDQAFPRDTGEYIGVDAMAGRDPSVDLILTSNIYTQMVNLGGAFFAGGVQEEPLWFRLPGLPTLCSMVRPRARPSDWDTNVSAAGMWTPSATWHATDPRLYEQGETASSPSSGGTSSTFTVTNTGNVEVRPVLVLNGPLHAPSVANNSISGAEIAFAAGTAIASGDAVVIDLSTPHTINYWTGGLGGGPVFNVYNWLDQSATSWWTLIPGANHLELDVSSGSLALDALEVWWSNAYIL